MDRIKQLIGKLAQPRVLITILVVAVIVAPAVFAYNKFVKPGMRPSYVDNKEFAEQGADSKEAVIYYFMATWCPVCKRAAPEWEKFSSDYDGKVINGYTLRTRTVDCEKEPELADKAKIEGYPTVKLMFGNQVIEYDANVKYDTLVEFVETSLQ